MEMLVTKVQRATVPGVAAMLIVVLSATVAPAQLPKGTAPPAKTEATATPDLLRRETPRSTVEGMARCGEREDFACLSRYLQPAPGLDMLEVSREFHALRSRYRGSIGMLSDDPNGRVEEGLLPGQQRAGVVEVGGRTTNIILVRVDDPDYGKIWLISTETVAKIPVLYAALQSESPTLSERMMPAALRDRHFLGDVAGAVAGMAALDPDFVALRLVVGFCAERAETNLAHSAKGPHQDSLGDEPRTTAPVHHGDRDSQHRCLFPRAATLIQGLLLPFPGSPACGMPGVAGEQAR